MKRLWLLLSLTFISIAGIAQSCEEREGKLLESMGSFSAAFLYNTYGMIGSITDGYMKDAYTDETLNDLMNAQKSVLDNLSEVMNKLIKDDMLKDPSGVDYCTEVVRIMKGLKKQAQLLMDYAKTRRNDKQDAYAEQRKENWNAISKLMGIEE